MLETPRPLQVHIAWLGFGVAGLLYPYPAFHVSGSENVISNQSSAVTDFSTQFGRNAINNT